MKLDNQVAIVTGAGRNIGKAIARLFAAEGARVVVVDMDKGRAQGVADELRRSGREAMPVVCDISSSKDVQEMVNKVVDGFGGVDILVNNAAITDRVDILESTEEEFEKVL
jgi:3-oxoacyl-[acyl-carrier protein] reductase